MIVKAEKSYFKDIEKLDNKKLKTKLLNLIEYIEKIEAIYEIPDFKKMKGSKTAYRIRVNNYRLGIYLENDTIILSRFLHRKDIYN